MVFQAKVGNYSLALKVERKVKKLPKDKKEKILLKTHYLEEIVQKVNSHRTKLKLARCSASQVGH